MKPTVPLAHVEIISELPAESVCKGKDITKQGMIDAMNQGSRDCMADIEIAGLSRFNIVQIHKRKIRRVEISPFSIRKGVLFIRGR